MFMGKEGWFFLKTDSDVLDQVRGLNRFTTDDELDEWIDLMEGQRRWGESARGGHGHRRRTKSAHYHS